MVGVIYAMLGASLVAIIVVIVMLVGRRGTLKSAGGQSYDVFAISENRLTVLAGIPARYALDEIEQITFSAMKAPKSVSTYNGILRVVKTNGKKSRPFLFNSSVLAKKTVLASSKQEIEETTQYLMGELRRHHIRCSRIG